MWRMVAARRLLLQPGMKPEHFEAEMIPHLDGLYAFARRLRRDPDDLVQETYLRAYQARASFRGGSNSRAWLYRILYHTAVNGFRRDARERRLCARLAAQPRELGRAAPEPSSSMRERLLRALSSLPAPLEQVVELIDVEGLGYRDAAERLGCPIGTIMSRLHRARRRLRAQIAA